MSLRRISQFLRILLFYWISRDDMSMQNKNKHFTISVCLSECIPHLCLKTWKKIKKKGNRIRIQFGYQNARDEAISYAYAFFSLIFFFLRDIKCTSFNVNVSKLKLLCGASEQKNLIMEITSYILGHEILVNRKIPKFHFGEEKKWAGVVLDTSVIAACVLW